MLISDANHRMLQRTLRPHLLTYFAAVVLLFAIDLFVAGPLWFHWPAMVWGVFAGTHYLYCKSFAVDEEWAEERANNLRLKSYDLGHINAIDESFNKEADSDDPSMKQHR